MTCGHELVHTLIVEGKGHRWSPTLNAVAHGRRLAPGVVEQQGTARVFARQRRVEAQSRHAPLTKTVRQSDRSVRLLYIRPSTSTAVAFASSGVANDRPTESSAPARAPRARSVVTAASAVGRGAEPSTAARLDRQDRVSASPHPHPPCSGPATQPTVDDRAARAHDCENSLLTIAG